VLTTNALSNPLVAPDRLTTMPSSLNINSMADTVSSVKLLQKHNAPISTVPES